ncbi:unnamed protein product, partial [marine sediment metagenome]
MIKTKDNEILDFIKKGRADYSWFMTHALDVEPEHLWFKMKEVNDSVRDNERTAVGAGHGVSKTYGGARIALTFLFCYYPSTVITTAPSLAQVKNIWREIRAAHTNARMPLGGKLTTLELDIQTETGVKWYATGISTMPDTVTGEATRLQGIHNDYVLIILEEAAAILPEIWRATEHIGAPFKRVLAIGNPTSKFGDFPAALRDPTWNHINISVTDTPNFKMGRQLIPGVYGKEYEQRIRLKYGKDSDEYKVRVLGGISERGAEGAYCSRKMVELKKKGRITDLIEHNPNYPVHIIEDIGYTTAIGFVQVIEGWSNFISYYEDSGISIEKYVDLFDEYKKERGYRYGDIIVPCDMDSNAHKVITGQTALETLRGFGYNAKPLPRERRFNEGVQRLLKYLDTCRFHKTRCARLIDCLEAHHEKKNKQMSTEDVPVFTGVPDKDGTDHGFDMVRYAS